MHAVSALRAVLIGLLVMSGFAPAVGQVYLCPNGDICQSCPAEPCPSPEGTCSNKARDGDCRDCCRLAAVPRSQEPLAQSSPAAAQSLEIPMAEAPSPEVNQPLRSVFAGSFHWKERHWPHAPPGRHPGRSPPHLPA